MINTVLFDLDGTLTDPKIGITKSVQYSLASFGIHEDLNHLETFIGPPLVESFKSIYNFDDQKAFKAVEKYREYFKDEGIFENQLYKGIPVLLQQLKSHSITLAVATSKPTVFAKRILEYFHIEQFFDGIIGSHLDNTRSDKKEIIEMALLKLAKQREESIMVGDRKHDIIGAQLNKVQSIGVLYGYGSISELAEQKPNHIVKDINELSSVLMTVTAEEHQ